MIFQRMIQITKGFNFIFCEDYHKLLSDLG